MLFFKSKRNILSRLYKMHLKHTILHKKKQKKNQTSPFKQTVRAI